MRIGIDIDNVISNFDEVLEKEFLIHDKDLRNTGIVDENLYITDGMFDWSKEEINSFYYPNIERIAKSLTLVDGSKEYIDKLKSDGHFICIITGRDNEEYSNPVEMTKEWLNDYNIYYDELIFTDGREKSSKAKVCTKNSIDIMIDDSSKICKSCLDNGIVSLLMDKPCNRNVNIPRVKSWEDIYNFISNYKDERLNVILDTDTYNECDDQFALAYLLKSQDKFKIKAITIAPYSHKKINITPKKSQELSCKEVLKICNYLDFDTSLKVFKGSTDYITNGYDEENEAVNKIIQVAKKNDKTYIMAIGAITNVAMAIKKAPNIIDKIEVIWLGGNSFLQEDNLEYNFRQDIEAVRIVFDSKVKLTVIPCKNVASNLVTSIYELEHYLKDKSELGNYLIKRFHDDGYHEIRNRRVIWDIGVVAYLINKSWFKVSEVSCPKIADDTSYIKTTDRHLITIVNYLDVNSIYNDLFSKLEREN